MGRVAERLSELRRYLDHLRRLRGQGITEEALRRDLSVRNDVLHSLLMVAQMVIDVAAELSVSAGLTFSDYREAVDNLRRLGFPEGLVDQLVRLPGFRNVVVHAYLKVDEALVLRALKELGPVEEFVASVAGRLGEQT